MNVIGIIVTVYLLIGLFFTFIDVCVVKVLDETMLESAISEISHLSTRTERIEEAICFACALILATLLWPVFIPNIVYFTKSFLIFVIEKVRNK